MIGATVRMIDTWNGSKKSLSMAIGRFCWYSQRTVGLSPLTVLKFFVREKIIVVFQE